jgi:outer membrane protein OmpA-like peptidoglycan-associated protein
MTNLRKTHLAIAMALTAGILSGCQNNSTREDSIERDREIVATENNADIENRNIDTSTAVTDAEYVPREEYPNEYSSVDQPRQAQPDFGDNGTILFEFDSADLTDSAKESLDALVSALEGQNTEIGALTIRGYTDATGPEEYNAHLSQRRAESVRSYLRDKGIEAGNWEVEGLGEESPVASNDDARGRSENRRVVVEMSTDDNRGLSSSYSAD